MKYGDTPSGLNGVGPSDIESNVSLFFFLLSLGHLHTQQQQQRFVMVARGQPLRLLDNVDKGRPLSPYEGMEENISNWHAGMDYVEWGEAPEEYPYYDFPAGPEQQFNEEVFYDVSEYADPWAYGEYNEDDIQNQLDNMLVPPAPAEDYYGYDPPPPLSNIVAPDQMDTMSYLNWDWGPDVDPNQIPIGGDFEIPYKDPISTDLDAPGHFDYSSVSPMVLDDPNDGPGDMWKLGLLGKHKIYYGSTCRTFSFWRFETPWWPNWWPFS